MNIKEEIINDVELAQEIIDMGMDGKSIELSHYAMATEIIEDTIQLLNNLPKLSWFRFRTKRKLQKMYLNIYFMEKWERWQAKNF